MELKQKPDIFKYLNYRIFLDDLYKYYKSINKSFSYRYIAQLTGASSTGWFPNIVKERINLTSNYSLKLQKVLKLNDQECEYFELLVAYNQAGNFEEKAIFLEKLKALQGIQPTLLRNEHLLYLTKWYISAIRELLLIFPFKDDFESLANMIIPHLDLHDAKEAINVLQNIGMVTYDKSGYLRPCDSVVLKDPAVKTDLWKSYMKSKGKLSVDAIECFSKECRDISEVYMPLSQATFEKACIEIAKLRNKLLVLSESEKNADRVYQCGIQLFPLTESTKNKTPQ